jgi:hypothetical protein
VTDKVDLDRVEVLCVLKDNYGAFVYTNKKMGDQFSAPTGGFEGKTEYHLMQDADAAAIRSNDKYVLATGNELKTIEWVQAGDARQAYLVRKFRIEVEGKMYLAVLGQYLGDDEKRLEPRQEQADDYIKPIEHELRLMLKQIAVGFSRRASKID